MISPEEHERVFNWLYDLGKRASFDIKSTAAPAYRRVVIQHQRATLDTPASTLPPLAGAGYRYADGLARPAKGVNDGNGFCFISHTGDVCPSGFLPVPAGNVREQPLADIYRNSTLFRELRDVNALKGKCGDCEYRHICGGSRSRAYAISGDPLAEDPSCVYQPAS